MPQTVYDLGDPITSRLTLGVAPDITTVVTVVVTRPDGTTQYSGPPAGSVGAEYSQQFVATATGDYVAVWTIAGTGAGVQAKIYNVRALPTASSSRPVWAPFLSDVADYIPRLTIDMVTPGSAVEYGTFNGLTTPTDEQAMRLVDAAVGSVLTAAGTIQDSIAGQATTVAALRAAAAIQRAYPRGSNEMSVADALDRRADAELARLIIANEAAGASPPSGVLLPRWSFPRPTTWGDLDI
jgi:hypothetical protein